MYSEIRTLELNLTIDTMELKLKVRYSQELNDAASGGG